MVASQFWDWYKAATCIVRYYFVKKYFDVKYFEKVPDVTVSLTSVLLHVWKQQVMSSVA